MSAEHILEQLRSGGDDGEAVLTTALEHALNTIETTLASMPRKQRKPVTQVERAEMALEAVDGDGARADDRPDSTAADAAGLDV